jgi:2-polyprenyl-3-methyl-5-hydroxy-6-metoxy-1,4-benzoquinol methylase
MLSRFKLIAKVLSFQVPPKLLIWGLLNMLNRSLRTGNRRFEFERLYLENPDPWNYRSSPYERQKYERTLACALGWRSASETALEVGCSVGVFSQMLARRFDKVTAIDVSKEALAAATDYNYAEKNIRFVHACLQSLAIPGRYDVIFCAEVLYYIAEADIQKVCRQLDRYLASDGVILLVTGMASGRSSSFYFDGWEEILGDKFELVFAERVDDPSRPYRIAIFSRRR